MQVSAYSPGTAVSAGATQSVPVPSMQTSDVPVFPVLPLQHLCVSKGCYQMTWTMYRWPVLPLIWRIIWHPSSGSEQSKQCESVHVCPTDPWGWKVRELVPCLEQQGNAIKNCGQLKNLWVPYIGIPGSTPDQCNRDLWWAKRRVCCCHVFLCVLRFPVPTNLLIVVHPSHRDECRCNALLRCHSLRPQASVAASHLTWQLTFRCREYELTS